MTPRLCATSLLRAATVVAQERPFSAESRVVLVPVTVTDEKGRIVDGLTVDDFRLLDNQVSRKLALGVGTQPARPEVRQ